MLPSAISLIFALILLSLAKCDHRKVEFDRIKKYELVYFDIDLTHSDTFEFDAFNQHYIVQLIPNTAAIPTNIKHTNSIPSHKELGIDEYFTSLTTSCHYFGRVINDKSDRLQRVSLSLCNKRGIRGEIRAFNETLVIKPAAYYLDIKYDNNHFHDIKDEHLIWRHSDFNFDGIPDLKEIPIDNPLHLDGSSRRRTLYNSGNNQLELLVVTDVPMTQYYKDTYSSSWYQQLVSDTADYVNTVSSIYQAGDFWDWGIGTISVHLVELEVIHEFTGQYAALQPSCIDYRECGKGWGKDYCQCTIDGTDYLDKFKRYIKSYRNQQNFDNAQLITKYYFANAGGWGFVGVICKTESNVANLANNYGVSFWNTGAAHEMGHNFGANHDGSNDAADCSSGQGIMGGSSEGFSYCSYRAIQKYFADNGGLSCLGTGVNTRIDTGNNGGNNNGGGNNGGGNTGDTNNYCLSSLTEVNGVDYNGLWTYGGLHDGYPYYTKDGYYMFYTTAYSAYWTNTQLGGQGTYIYCSESSIASCTAGKWNYYGAAGWTADSYGNINTNDCSDGTGNNGGNNGGGNSCTYYNCIGLYNIETSWDGESLPVYYKPQGCHNDVGYYVSDDGTRYLYRVPNGNWNVYDKLDDDSTPYVLCTNHADDLLGCGNNMMYYSLYYKQWSTDTDSWVFECNQALNFEDECENINIYNDELCIEGTTNIFEYNQTVWTLVDDGICENNMPLYHFEIDDENITYYLSFQETQKYTDSNETEKEWIIKRDDSQIAYCKQENLLNCIAGQWYIFGIDSDAIAFNLDDNMTIYNNNQCVISVDDGKQENNDTMSGIEIFAICLVFVVVLTLIIFGFCMYYRSKMKFKHHVKKTIDDDEPDEVEEQEIEVDVEINAITQTND